MMRMKRANVAASTRDRIERMSQGRVSRWVILRDLFLFQLKLFLDGLIDVTLAPLSIGAAIVEIFFGGERRGRLFYAILRFGERADLWLNLYGASRGADTDGLFGGSKAGSDTLLGEIEELVRGGDEPRRLRKRQ
ncbi:MAG: hypothetical protein JSV86_04495 [Gemmatimonadota bacterium]|nr:MAG: hypothetical protein JSV86_04495 [Gemmatimonadota bacterium]